MRIRGWRLFVGLAAMLAATVAEHMRQLDPWPDQLADRGLAE